MSRPGSRFGLVLVRSGQLTCDITYVGLFTTQVRSEWKKMSAKSTRKNRCYEEFVGIAKDKDKLCQFIQDNNENESLVNSINTCFENFAVTEVDDRLYEALFNLYQHGNQLCQLFVLQFAPALISAHLSLIGRRLATGGGKLETLILSIYNKEAAMNAETPFTKSFRIPSLSNSSIYHEPASATSTALTERALSRHEQSEKPVLLKVATKILPRLSASVRSEVIQTILDCYNRSISVMLEASHISFCKMTVRAARSGYPHFDCDDIRLTNVLKRSELDAIKHYTRIKLSNEAYQQMIHGLYFIMHDGLADQAIVALECLKDMSKYYLNAALAMTLNAMTDSIQRALRESEVRLARNPHHSIRRVPDQSKRRYAMSTGTSLQAPSVVVNSIDSGGNHVENNTHKEESLALDHVTISFKSLVSVEESGDSTLPNRGERNCKLPSESEDEAVNENTQLLASETASLRTESSDLLIQQKLSDVRTTDSEGVSMVDGESSFKFVDPDGRSDTAL